MSFFAIQNFRFGLDVRRSEYTSQPGTLLTLNNCHVNEGGEIEKRMAFSIAALTTANTFGLVVGATQLYVFGSVATPAGFPLTLFGKQVIYQRCQHPDGATAMSGVVTQATFSGLPFIVAQFTDGNQYPFYNGTLVSDFTSGLILASLNTDTKIGTAFSNLVNATSPLYTSIDRGGGIVDVFGTPGGNYTSSVVKILQGGSTGALTTQNNGPGVDTTPGQSSVGQFQIVAGKTGTITSVQVNGVEICVDGGGLPAVPWTNTNVNTATLIAKQINLYNIAHPTIGGTQGYVASANSQAFVVISTVAQSTTANTFVVKVTATTDVCVGNALVTFSFATQPAANTLVIATADINLSVAQFGSSANLFAAAQTINWGPSSGVNTTALLAAAIATKIQANVANSGCIACAVDSTLYVSAAVTTSTDPQVQLNLTTHNNVITTFGTTVGVTNALSPAVSPATGTAPVSTFATYTGTNFNCLVTGGIPPYKYNWLQVGIPQNLRMRVSSNGGTTATFFDTQTSGQSSQWVCQVTDATGTSANSNTIIVSS